MPSRTSYVEVGRRQCQDVIRHHAEAPENLLFLGDSGYCRRAFIYPLVAEEGTNMVVRLRHNRVVYGPPPLKKKGIRGRRCRYGTRLTLNDPTTWPAPNGEEAWEEIPADGRQVRIHLKVWHHMRLRGTRPYPVYRCSFTLIQITITTPHGRPLYRCPLWPAFFGPKCQVWAPKRIYWAYCRRFDQEHMHHFLTYNLPATAYEIPDTEHEERW